ncbi:MAG TPA: hypothetical protein VE982_04735 [Gaiellaceae bacterium]|nr:hypothetical protein [Gaiellaceae bacterium]
MELDGAETQLASRWIERRERVQSAALITFIVCVQIAWLAAFGYLAYVFVF